MAADAERNGQTERPAVRRRRQPARLARAMRIGRLLPKEVVALYRKRGFLHHEIVARWPLIVGEDLARVTLPLAIRRARGPNGAGTLELKVAPGFAPAVQHDQERILAAVNRHFGHRAVARLQIRQGPVRPPERTAPAPPAAPSAAASARAGRLAARVADPELGALLARWGAFVLSAADARSKRGGGPQNGAGQAG
ncbi:MAG: hypothetical protein KatS3mg119_0729 [Rhodothalassiaceae bacterium]|nr:MAG: hypothetical protein KatS3mg119_0729 [Rhodothalassiaceae bacterium]